MKTALITGGTRGIGLGIAHCLVEEGFQVAVNGVRPADAVVDVIKTLSRADRPSIYCRGDISRATERQQILDILRREWGQINLLVNSAGVAPRKREDILEASEESYDQVMDVNLKGTYFMTKLVANWMVERKQVNHDFEGQIVFITSISATLASPNRGDYCISKAGLAMASRLWAVRLAEYDIPVYEVRPGVIETDMTRGVKSTYDRLLKQGLALQPRWGTPEDVGRTVAALARDDLPYSSGAVIMVDGGLAVPRLLSDSP